MESEQIFFIAIGILFIIIALITAFFSSIVLITIISNWRTKCHSVSNLLICNSCAAFLFFIITISIQIPQIFQVNEKESKDIFMISCRIRAFLYLLACVAIVCSYLNQAISRFFITVLYKRKYLLTYRTNIILIITSWVISIIISGAAFISPVSLQYEPESRLCVLTSKVFHTSFTTMVVAFIIPVNIIVTLYGLILWHTTRANRVQPNSVTTRNNKRNIKVFQNILMLLMIVIVGGTLYLLCTILNTTVGIPQPLYSISLLFIVLSSAVESVTIFFTNKEVKTIIYIKIGVREADGMHVIHVIPTTKRLTLHIGTNQIETIQAII